MGTSTDGILAYGYDLGGEESVWMRVGTTGSAEPSTRWGSCR
jgi:hypothetical protein